MFVEVLQHPFLFSRAKGIPCRTRRLRKSGQTDRLSGHQDRVKDDIVSRIPCESGRNALLPQFSERVAVSRTTAGPQRIVFHDMDCKEAHQMLRHARYWPSQESIAVPKCKAERAHRNVNLEGFSCEDENGQAPQADIWQYVLFPSEGGKDLALGGTSGRPRGVTAKGFHDGKTGSDFQGRSFRHSRARIWQEFYPPQQEMAILTRFLVECLALKRPVARDDAGAEQRDEAVLDLRGIGREIDSQCLIEVQGTHSICESDGGTENEGRRVMTKLNNA